MTGACRAIDLHHGLHVGRLKYQGCEASRMQSGVSVYISCSFKGKRCGENIGTTSMFASSLDMHHLPLISSLTPR
jgi:hypothetical protein